MQGRVIISDAGSGIISAHKAVDLTELHHARIEGQPGSLCSRQGDLFCATVADASIWRLRCNDFQPLQCYAAGMDVERICLSQDGTRLYALIAGCDSLLMLDTEAGLPMMSAPVGVHPRDMRLDHTGRFLAVAGGASGSVLLLEADTLRQCAEYPVSGIACGVFFAPDGLMALCASGDYELDTLVGHIRPHQGGYRELWKLPGLPGCFAMGINGLLVGHLGMISMINLGQGAIRWQLAVQGLPDCLLPLGRIACYTDKLAGRVGLVDCFRPGLLRVLRKEEPCGLAFVEGP